MSFDGGRLNGRGHGVSGVSEGNDATLVMNDGYISYMYETYLSEFHRRRFSLPLLVAAQYMVWHSTSTVQDKGLAHAR